MFGSLLTGFKSSLGARWADFYAPVEAATKAALQRGYGIN
jgi:hypothetical protein